MGMAAAIEAFGTAMANLRNGRPYLMTQIALARATGVSESQISNIECGRAKNLRRRTVEKLAKAIPELSRVWDSVQAA